MKVLVVGGAGYIGSVTVEQLLAEGHEVVVLDNLLRGHQAAIPENVKFIHGDMENVADLEKAFKDEQIAAVMHFAALSLVGESVEHPALYFHNNVANGLKLLDTMIKHNVRKFVFSSTAAVYGEPENSPISEDFPLTPTNPYGDSKLAFEKVLKWYSNAYGIRYASLRYFNAAGATERCGEDHDPETHLIPAILQVARGMRDHATIFGDDYKTPDGTCIRDYIHVSDLADAHIRALDYLHGRNGIFNLGSERGFSVKEVIETARKVTGHPIASSVGPRRAGDPAILVASSELARRELKWAPKKAELATIIEDAWKWHQKHPAGYKGAAVHV